MLAILSLVGNYLGPRGPLCAKGDVCLYTGGAWEYVLSV